MMHKATFRLRGVCVAAGLTFFLSVAIAAQHQPALFVNVDFGHATIVANDVPIKAVLEELAMQTGIIVYSRANLNATGSWSIRDKPVPEVVRRLLKHRNFTFHYVSDAATGQPVFGSRLWVFADDATVATSLWSVGDPPSAWTLKYAAGDSDRNRLIAISNMTAREDKTNSGPELFAAMNDPSVAVREEAVIGLSDLDDRLSASYLKHALYDPDDRVRIAAITALAESETDDAAIALAGLLNDQDTSIRSEVIHALADIGTDTASQFLQQGLADSDENNRQIAAGYLSEFDGLGLPK